MFSSTFLIVFPVLPVVSEPVNNPLTLDFGVTDLIPELILEVVLLFNRLLVLLLVAFIPELSALLDF